MYIAYVSSTGPPLQIISGVTQIQIVFGNLQIGASRLHLSMVILIFLSVYKMFNKRAIPNLLLFFSEKININLLKKFLIVDIGQRVLNRWSKLSEQKLRFFSKVKI